MFGADANFAFISGKNVSNVGMAGSPDTYGLVVEDGNIVQITLPTYMNGTYIRFTVHSLTEDSIITVNETID